MYDRRTFLGSLAGLALGSVNTAPWLRPRARAASAFAAERVVILSLGGGLRRMEALGFAHGATMPRLFGDVPLISGFGASAAGAPVYAPEYLAAQRALALPAPSARPLYEQGTLLANLRYEEGAPGHLQGAGCLVSGRYNQIENRADARLSTPTVFELHRQATGAPATDAWYLSTLGGFYSALQASDYAGLGARYGGLYLSPPAVMSPILPLVASGRRKLDVTTLTGLPFVPNNAKAQAKVAQIKRLLDGNSRAYLADPLRFAATEEEAQAVRAHLAELFADPSYQALFPDAFGIGLREEGGGLAETPDAVTIFHAERILARFSPSVMVISLLDIDACHTDFNGYLRGQELASALVTHLWEFIQSEDGLRDRTALFVLPEHGRHLYDNGKNADSLGRSGIDHGDGDDGDRDVFVLALGPDFKQGEVIEPSGPAQEGRRSGAYETIDVVATALSILGHEEAYKQAIEADGGRPGLPIEELFR